MKNEDLEQIARMLIDVAQDPKNILAEGLLDSIILVIPQIPDNERAVILNYLIASLLEEVFKNEKSNNA